MMATTERSTLSAHADGNQTITRGLLIPTVMLRHLVVPLAASTALGTSLPSTGRAVLPSTSHEGHVLNDSIDQFVLETISEWNSPGGVAVAFVQQTQNGEWQVETQGYGRAKVDGSAVDEDTLFAIASNSKVSSALTVPQYS